MRKDTEKNQALYGEKFGGLAFFSFITLYIILSFVGQAVLSVLNLSSTADIAVGALFSVICMQVVLWASGKFRKEKFIYTAKVKKFDPAYLIPALLLSFGMLFGLGFVNYLVSDLVVSLGGKVTETTIPLNSVWQLLLFCFLLGVLPAFEEECFFRGLIFSSFKNSSVICGTLITSLCFAFYHGNVSQLVYQFIYGVCLALLAVRSKSVLPGIVAHLLNNVVILVLEYAGMQIDFFNAKTIAVGLCSLAGYILFSVFYKKNNGEFAVKSENKKRGAFEFFIPYGLAGLLLCTITIIAGVSV